MKILSDQNMGHLNGCLSRYNNWISTHVSNPTQSSLGQKPKSLHDFEQRIRNLPSRLQKIINNTQSRLTDEFPLGEKEIIKRIILFERQHLSERFEEQITQTNNAEIRKELEAPLEALKALTDGEWFNEVQPIRTPKLTDFLTVEQSERHLSVQLEERQYDEKFHILIAPQLFLKDLKFYRESCGLRDTSVCIGFLDIDNFKKFNTENGETTVDREVLPRFMACLEAHVYARGFAYRYGGDEYAIILPNTDLNDATNFIQKLKMKFEAIDYGRIAGEKPNVTVGVFEATADTPLTNPECLSLAEKAKNEGKKETRGSIWSCDINSIGDPKFHQVHPAKTS